MSRRDAEVRADAVSLVGLDDAAVLLDRAAHHGHALADEHLRLVRLEPFAERGRADDVGEEHGDRAALVLHLPHRSRGRRTFGRSVLWIEGRNRYGRRYGAERVVLPQDRLLELPQLSGGLEAELVVEELSERPIRVEGVRMTTGAVERHHEQCSKALVERMEIDESLQLADRFGLAPHREHGLEASLERLESQALQPSDLRTCERLRGEVGERGAAPESKRLGQARLGLGERLGPKCGLPAGEESLEHVDVDDAWGDTEDVSGLLRGEPAVVAEEPTELRDVDLDAVRRGHGRVVSPECVDEPVAGHDAIALEQEQGEHAALLLPAEGERAAVVEDLQRPQHSELDQRPPLSATRQP